MLNKIAKQGKLSIGIVFPIESYPGAIAKMENQEALATRAEQLGFKALWFRDVPFHDPTFGDAGQMYDPWVYMTHIMNHTREIVLATGSIILPLRHPVHTAKSFLSLQKLSKGRVILGIASGDRLLEYPAFNRDVENRAVLFRENFFYTKNLLNDFPTNESPNYGRLNGALDLLPKHDAHTPMLVTGHSGQKLEWIAEHADGWLYYPRNLYFLQNNLEDWHNALEATKQNWKPFMQSLYVDLVEEKKAERKPIHLGFSAGEDYILEYLKTLEKYGVSHVILNLKYGTRPAKDVIEHLGEAILPHFN